MDVAAPPLRDCRLAVHDDDREPIAIIRRVPVDVTLPSSAGGALRALAGVAFLAVGLTLFGSSLGRFATEGKGTLAPWDPRRELVLGGPYRYVRNPMISGVIFILFAQALSLRSRPTSSGARSSWR